MFICRTFLPLKRSNKKTTEKPTSISYFALFRYAHKWDYVLIALGIAFTIVKSFCMPLFLIAYGEQTTMLVDRTYRIGTTSRTHILPVFGGGRIL